MLDRLREKRLDRATVKQFERLGRTVYKDDIQGNANKLQTVSGVNNLGFGCGAHGAVDVQTVLRML